MMRVFVAVDISDHITDEISKFQASSGIGGKPVKPHNMHFTLQFLGNISQDNSKRVIGALSGMAFSKFDIKLQGLGVFPEKRSPRIVWVGTDRAGGQKLRELSDMVRHTLAPLGYSNSTFKPHVTIFRLKPRDMISRLAEFAETSFGMQQVLTIKLKQSVLSKDGPTYTDLAEVAA